MEVSDALRSVRGEDESIIFTVEAKVCKVEHMPKANEVHTNDEFICASQTQKDFCLKLEYFPGHIAEIEQETKGQTTNPVWFAVRQHMIPAFKAHDVKTRMTTLKRASQGKIIDFKNLIDKIAGRKS